MDSNNMNNENMTNTAGTENQAPNQGQFSNQNQYSQNQHSQNQYAQNNQNQYYQVPNYPVVVPGKNKAVASLVLGILSIVFIWGGFSGFVSVILSVIGLILASSAKKDGFDEGIRTAGFVTSLIGLIGGLLAVLACVACIGAFGAVTSSRDFERAADEFFYDFYGRY